MLNGADDPQTFVVEVMRPALEAEVKRMLGERLYLIVGTPHVFGDTVTIIAEIFFLKDTPDAEARFAKEQESWWQIMSSQVEQNPKKRSAKFLMEETPSKKQCQSV